MAFGAVVIQTAIASARCANTSRRSLSAADQMCHPWLSAMMVTFVHERAQVAIYNADRPLVGFGSMPDTLGLLAWLCKDEMIAKLDKMIDEACAGDKGMTHTDRQKSEAAVMQDPPGRFDLESAG
jgi:hypothetical protein